MSIEKVTDAALTDLLVAAGFDLSVLPAVATAQEVAPVMGVTVSALAQDRYRREGIPFVKFGKRVRYLRADVARYLMSHRSGDGDAL